MGEFAAFFANASSQPFWVKYSIKGLQADREIYILLIFIAIV